MICAVVPEIVSEELPLPVTLAPLVPLLALSVPSPTEMVSVSDPEPPSTSPTDNPLFFRLRVVCSVAL